MHAVEAANNVRVMNSPEPSRTAAADPGFASALAHAQMAGASERGALAPAHAPTVTLGEMVHIAAVRAPQTYGPAPNGLGALGSPNALGALGPNGLGATATASYAPLTATASYAPLSAPGAYAPLSAAGVGAGAATGWMSPVDGRISSHFGPRIHPITGRRKMHDGIDIAAPQGTPIRAVAAGTVTFAGRQGGYGNLVIVRHPDGSETRYAHQQAIGVRVGQVVTAGAHLGTVGSTGASTGPHLHLELRRNGEPVDPRFIVAGGQH